MLPSGQVVMVYLEYMDVILSRCIKSIHDSGWSAIFHDFSVIRICESSLAVWF